MSSVDEIDLLARVRDDVPPADPTVLLRARRRLLERAVRPRHGQLPVGVRVRPLRRRLVALAALAAVGAAGLVAADVVPLGGQPPGASAAAAAVLHQAAERATRTPDPRVGPDEYLHITTRALWSTSMEGPDGRPLTWLDLETIEVWMPGDPSREWVLRRSGRVPYTFFRPEDERAVRDLDVAPVPGERELLRARDQAFYGPTAGSWQTPTPEFLAELPRHPERLLRIIREAAGDSGPSRDGEALVYVADVLRSGIVPADLRAALFRTATLIPGVDVVDGRANLDGRPAVAVGRDEEANGFRQEILFDPETGAFVGERQVALRAGDGFPAGAVTASTAVTTAVTAEAP